jgi:hypothetical protein
MPARSCGLVRETAERLESLLDIAEVRSRGRRGQSFVEDADHVRRSSEPHVQIHQRFTSFIGGSGGRGFANRSIEMLLGISRTAERRRDRSRIQRGYSLAGNRVTQLEPAMALVKPLQGRVGRRLGDHTRPESGDDGGNLQKLSHGILNSKSSGLTLWHHPRRSKCQRRRVHAGFGGLSTEKVPATVNDEGRRRGRCC